MKTTFIHRDMLLVVGLLTALALLAPSARAQARRSGTTSSAKDAVSRDRVTIRKIDGVGSSGRVKTPEYNVTISENRPVAQDWARILVHFETAADWIDELEFRYFVQVKQQKTGQMLRFLGTFQYVDIPKSRHNRSCVFLRPATVERYGDIIGVAVEVYSKGELVAAAANPTGPQGWWRTATTREVPGVLLERSQTPFAFIAYDAYVTAKPK